MFKTNVGGFDRVLRIVIGVVLIAGYFLLPGASYRWVFWIGLIPLLTGIFRTCPLYSILGLNTCPMKR